MTDTDLRQLTPTLAHRRDLHTSRGDFAAIWTEPDEPRGTVLAVPGYTGSKEDFVPILNPLTAAGWAIVAVDQRGQYESAGSDDSAAYSTDELGLDVAAMATAICDDPVHLLGHSFGGLTTRAAVIADPARFSSLTLMSTGPRHLEGPRKSVVEAAFALLGKLPMDQVYDLNQQLAGQDPAFFAPAEPLKSFYRDRFVRTAAMSLLGMGKAMLSEPDRVEQLRRTDVRTLVIYGESDNAWSPALQQTMANRLGAEVAIIPKAAHSPALENPAATFEALNNFWRAKH